MEDLLNSTIEFKILIFWFVLVLHKTCDNFMESCLFQILRPDLERTRSELFKTGLKTILAILNPKLGNFAKKSRGIDSNPLRNSYLLDKKFDDSY